MADQALVLLKAPLIAQQPELATGCEITATTMLLQYAGAKVTKTQLADEMPRSTDDPNTGFVGDPYSEDGDTIYPVALLPLVKKYAGSASDLSGKSLDELKAIVADGKPVVVWVGNYDGFHTHALLMTGYDKGHIYFNDCWTDQKDFLSPARFQAIRDDGQNRALSY